METENLFSKTEVTSSLLDSLPVGERVAEDLRSSYANVQTAIDLLGSKVRQGGSSSAVYTLDKMLERRSRLLDDIRAYLAANDGTAMAIEQSRETCTSELNNTLLNLVSDLRVLFQEVIPDPRKRQEADIRLRHMMQTRYVTAFNEILKNAYANLQRELG